MALTAATPTLAQPPSAGEPAQPAARAEVLVLGVYHMANPGRDIFNMKADDVLAPKRQAKIAQLIEVLKRFHPTKIEVEGDVWDDRIPKRYADYVAGKHELSRNEIEQIGFRLAKELGHQTVYSVDVDGEFPFPRLVNYAKASGRSKELDAIMGEIGAMVKAQDLVSDWFRRNMRIYSNVTRLADYPSERVLVIFGAGHLGWLRHDVSSDPTLRLRKLAEFVK